MSDPSDTRRLNAGNARRARLGIEGAAIRTGIVVLAHAVLIGNAIAGTEYAVDGVAVGTQLNFGSASYREYKCNPSDQFEGFIWCQKTRTEKERQGSYIAGHSLLHSKNGDLSYVNRSQEPAFFNPSEADLNIQQYSRKFGESARILKMPHRSGLPDGVIAIWGKITLEPLEQESIKTLAGGRNPRKGFLIDYLHDFTRSAKEGLPIYRIDGGPGFIWAASFDRKGRGTLRLAAVDLSRFVPSPESGPVVDIGAPTHLERLPAPAAVVATTASTHQEELPPPATVVATAGPTYPEELSSELNQTIEELRADLAISATKIAELERAKSVAERALEEAEQAKLDAENAKKAVEQARLAEKTTSDALIVQLRADKAAAGAKISRWEIGLYGSVGGLLFFLIASAIEFLIKRRNASVLKKSVEKPRTEPIEATALSQNPRARLELIAISEAAFERNLEEEVAALNAASALH
jgi:hypothetical protein